MIRLAELIHVAGYMTFPTEVMPRQDIITQLSGDILEEVAKVKAYMGSWKTSGLIPEVERKGVFEEVAEICEDAVGLRPWPVIEVGMNEEGRFVKAFPLEFPMGVGDLKQPQIRNDFSPTEWGQHKFRYFDGRFVDSSRGHRLVWAIYDTILLELTRHRGYAYHKATDSEVLTKQDLRDFVASRDDLVRQMAAHGADIPTTAMFWKNA